jgi:4'-phosphopantetheinyl transferase
VPLLLDKKNKNGSRLHVWQLRESSQWFYERIKLNNEEKGYYDSISYERRKQEWLAVRYLLKSKINASLEISYNDEGKPFIPDSYYRISISHSHDLVGLMVSDTSEVGLDIELISDRVERIAARFLEESELKMVGNEQRLEKLVTLWGAKEAIIKVIGNRRIDFKREIHIEPFDISKFGVVHAKINCPTLHHSFKLHYFQLDNYMIVMTEW